MTGSIKSPGSAELRLAQMTSGPTSRTGRGPAHRRRGRSDGRDDLSGRRKIEPKAVVPTRTTTTTTPAKPRRLRKYVLRSLWVLLVVAVGVGAGFQWSRPIPAAAFHPAGLTSIRLPGTSPSLPWPTTGSAALSMEGVGSLGSVGGDKPVPIASITKVMTAYVVLKDHPLAAGAAGPAIPVDAATLAAYQDGLATQQSVVKVVAGESLTEQEALEGLLIPSGNDLATLLADWDDGSSTAFVTKMNSAAQSLGLSSTHFTDVSGLDPGSMSTATDLIRLGEAAMALPAFSQIVGLGEATLPVAGLVYNFDYALGRQGIVGIKTGTDAAAGGCFLFEAKSTVDGQKVTVVGAVLGQQTGSPITAVLEAAEALTKAAFAEMTQLPVVAPGTLVGRIEDRWGASVDVTTAQSPKVVGWPGVDLPAQLDVGALPSVVGTGTRLGVLKVDMNGQNLDIDVTASHPLSAPSALWRMTRL
jgi:serine-type D-Ala-D-Ala carboxypeptidase (penicillin-binding protein 5/6)